MAYQFFYYAPRMRHAEELKKAEQARVEALQPRQPETTAPAEPEPEVSRAESPTDTAGTVSPSLPPAALATPEYVTVSSPLYEITLSTIGGEIVAARLLDYDTDDQPVQLVRTDSDFGGGFLQVVLAGDDESFDLGGVAFEAFTARGNEPLADGSIVTVAADRPETKVIFRAGGPRGMIEREYTFTADRYLVRSSVRFAASAYPFARNVQWSFGPGMRSTETDHSVDFASMRTVLRMGDEYYKHKRGDFDEDFSGTVQWAALQIRYFTAIILPETPTPGEAAAVGVKDSDFLSASITLPAAERQGRVTQLVDVYLGPLDYQRLKHLGRGVEKNVDVGFDHFKFMKPVSVAVLWGVLWLHKWIPNYGLVIILISVLTKVLFYRLTHKSFKSMRDMQALQPRLQALKEKYKDDKQKLSQETMRIYKEAGVNPLGGCLPMLLQMPVFIALFNVLRNTIELRQAPFFGWINDLSQQDVLFTLPFSLPLIGTALSVLPILMGGSMLLQSKIGGSITGPSSGTAQPKALTYMLPVVFTLLFYKMPSGLVLYWLVNTILSVAQQYYINKGADKEKENHAKSEEPTQPVEPPKAPRKARPKPGRARTRKG